LKSSREKVGFFLLGQNASIGALEIVYGAVGGRRLTQVM
jgi:hypothetical protein